jgi:hypothetical protein
VAHEVKVPRDDTELRCQSVEAGSHGLRRRSFCTSSCTLGALIPSLTSDSDTTTGAASLGSGFSMAE